MNWTQLIQSAYRPIGIHDTSDKPDLIVNGLEVLNMMLASWRGESLTVYASTVEQFTLTPSQASYEIGPTAADFVTTRPLKILSAYIRKNNVDLQIEVGMANVEYDSVMVKNAVISYPRKLYYQPLYPDAKIFLWPCPVESFPFFIDTLKPLVEEIAQEDIENETGLPPEYHLAIRSNLSVLLAEDQGVPVTPTLLKMAMDSKGNVKRINSQPVPQALFDLSLKDQNLIPYNIYKG